MAQSLCFVLQRQLSMGRFQLGKKHVLVLYDGRRTDVKGGGWEMRATTMLASTVVCLGPPKASHFSLKAHGCD